MEKRKRRSFSKQYKAEVVGGKVRLLSDELEREKLLVDQLKKFQLTTRVGNLRKRGSADADAEMLALLSSLAATGSKTLTEGAVYEFERLEIVDLASTLKVGERFAYPGIGEGIARLENFTIPIDQPLYVDGKRVREEELNWGRVHLALGAGKAAGASIVLIPEEFPVEPIRLDDIVRTLEGAIVKRRAQGLPDGVAVIVVPASWAEFLFTDTV